MFHGEFIEKTIVIGGVVCTLGVIASLIVLMFQPPPKSQEEIDSANCTTQCLNTGSVVKIYKRTPLSIDPYRAEVICECTTKELINKEIKK